ncbi:MAG: endo-1,4-beta-xylanase [Candidatus Brocadiia bacterium]
MVRTSLCLLLAGLAANAGTNLVRNPSFETDADGDGTPDAWHAAHDRACVTLELALDAGRDGSRCARLACSRFRPGSPAAHAMLAQNGVALRRGHAYRVSLWARARDLEADVVSVAVSDTTVWANCGLYASFNPDDRWRRFRFLFRATRDVGAESRFQLWFTSTGTLWVDDVEVVEAEGELRRPGHVIPPARGINGVPNSSFEVGTAGWGSAAVRPPHWGTRLDHLVGEVDQAHAVHGRRSLRIRLAEETVPVAFFDYFDPVQKAVWAPLAGNIGFLQVEPGTPHTFSVHLRADRAGVPARLEVRPFSGRPAAKAVRLTTQWQRCALTFTPRSRWCSVLAGPDLRAAEGRPAPPRPATVWLDAAQLERGERASAYAPRAAVEFAVTTGKTGNVFGWEEPVAFRIALANHDAAARDVSMELVLTDFFDREAWRQELDLRLPPGQRLDRQVVPRPGEPLRGYFRLRARLSWGETAAEQDLRLAVIPIHEGRDSRFGMNHAYPWPHLLDLCRKAGLVWVRDWSLKWQDVEPEKGRFTFAVTDPQIDRPLGHGLRVLGLLPFPSSPWASTAPPEMRGSREYTRRRAVVAMAPRDVGEFETYVERTVAHYRGRVSWFQVFNEPLYTSYALPQRHGYDGATYAKYTRAFCRAARRADPQAKVLAGVGGLRFDHFQSFFAAGGLEGIDAVDVHHYPRTRPPEFIEDELRRLAELMARHGGPKPIWITEYGYYADDQPWAVPIPHQGHNQPLRDETTQCAYAVRWATLALANGAEKVFYHAGTCDGLNRDSLQGIFHEYGGQPHKIYAAQAVLSRVLAPSCRFVRRLDLPGEGVRGHLFRDGERLTAVLWAPRGAKPQPVRLASPKLELWDLMARRQARRQLDPGPVPVYVTARGLSEAAFAAALQ